MSLYKNYSYFTSKCNKINDDLTKNIRFKAKGLRPMEGALSAALGLRLEVGGKGLRPMEGGAFSGVRSEVGGGRQGPSAGEGALRLRLEVGGRRQEGQRSEGGAFGGVRFEV
jgi:hypothetical protein